MSDIYTLIGTHVVAEMTPVINLTQIETIAGTPVKYKLYTCETQWITYLTEITIDGVVYTVREFVEDEYIIVTGASAPVQLFFQLDAPDYQHGAHRKVNSERQKKEKNKQLITPMVYMLPTKNRGGKYDSLYSFDGKLSFFFLHTFDASGDATIDTQQVNVVNPMSKMAKYFILKYSERRDIFEEILDEIEEDDHMDFGDPAVWGNKEKIFNENLSGVGINFDSQVYKSSGCCGTDIPESSCLPARLKLENILIETIQSGGLLNIILKDSDGNTPVYLYDANTHTLTVEIGSSSFTYDLYNNGVDSGVDVVVDGTDITINSFIG